MSSLQKLLIFPIDMPQAEEVARNAKILGMQVLGASSEASQSHWVDKVIYLPYVTATDFPSALTAALEKHRIDQLHTDHPAVWSFLDNWRQQLAQRNVRFDSAYPYDNLTRRYEPSFIWAVHTADWDLFGHADISQSEPSSDKIHKLAGLHFFYNCIPGESDDAKLATLYKLAFKVPANSDWVEIGSLYGKSAYALGWLARRTGQHSLVCVDPWATDKTEDQGQQADLINRQRTRLDTESVFNIFLANASHLENVSHIRSTSQNAASYYRQMSEESQGGNRPRNNSGAQVRGQVGLLHIDGNHSYESAKLDIECWAPLMAKGGWMVVDDYRWSFGDGPKVAADEFLESGRADLAFAVGDTLYMRVL